MKFTVADIMAEKPCKANYPEERIVALADGRGSVTADEIASLDIPIDDRIWILSRLLYRLSPYRANRCARMIALSVAHMWKCPEIVWWYLFTGDDTALDAALDATRYATRAAARATARDATRDAASDSWDVARDAARATAWYATRAATRAAARDAAWDAAWYATRAAARDAAWDAAWYATRAAASDSWAAAWYAARATALERHLETLVMAFG